MGYTHLMVTVTVYGFRIEERLKYMTLYSRSMGDSTQKREEGGRFKEKVTLDDVMDTFERVEGPVVTSSDVAEEFDCTPKTARNKLDELASHGRVDGRETAGRTVWWRTEDEEGEQ